MILKRANLYPFCNFFVIISREMFCDTAQLSSYKIISTLERVSALEIYFHL